MSLPERKHTEAEQILQWVRDEEESARIAVSNGEVQPAVWQTLKIVGDLIEGGSWRDD